MLQDYNNMTMEELVDLLAQETEKFTHLMASKEDTPEYGKTKETIEQILAVLKARNKQ